MKVTEERILTAIKNSMNTLHTLFIRSDDEKYKVKHDKVGEIADKLFIGEDLDDEEKRILKIVVKKYS